MPTDGLSHVIVDKGLQSLVARIAELSQQETGWAPLRGLGPELRERAEWLGEQMRKLPEPLVAVLFGGTGTGKSTLLNALAGAPIAETGDRRPTTEEPTVYYPADLNNCGDIIPSRPGIIPGLHEPQKLAAKYVPSDHLDSLVLIDMPDTDSVRTEHVACVQELLQRADVVLFCGTQQKYTNDKSLSLLRPLKDQRKIVCIQTRADQDTDIRHDWLRRLRDEGFSIENCYRVSARNAFARKCDKGLQPLVSEPADDEFEFAALEEYLREKLPPERLDIKRQNLRGAIKNVVELLNANLASRAPELKDLDERLHRLEAEVARETFAELEAQLLNDPAPWVVALGDAVSERAFGLIGTLYRVLHWVWLFPSRLTGKRSFFRPRSQLSSLRPRSQLSSLRPRSQLSSWERNCPGSSASSDVSKQSFFSKDVPNWKVGNEEDEPLDHLADRFQAHHAEASAYLARAGFAAANFDDWRQIFVDELGARLEEHFRPVQARLRRRAGRIARWLLPLFELGWFAPFAFTVGVPLCHYYWRLFRHAEVALPDPGFLQSSAAMLLVVLFIEIVLFAYFIRLSGRQLYRRLRRTLRKQMEGAEFGFASQRTEVQRAINECAAIRELEALVE